jgi:hypothetical protein
MVPHREVFTLYRILSMHLKQNKLLEQFKIVQVPCTKQHCRTGVSKRLDAIENDGAQKNCED